MDMDAKIDFLYLSEPDMIKAGVKDMKSCVDVMEDLLITLYKGDYVMGGANHNSHGCMIMFPDDPQFPGMPKNADDRRFMAMPAYLGGSYQMAGMKWYGSNVENKKVGVGAKYLARKDSRVVSIIGPGVMGKTSLAAFVSVCPNLDTVKIKGRSQRSLDAFTKFIREELPQIKNIEICDSVEEAVKDSDIISFTTTVRDDVSSFPYINGDWVKKGALISMPSAARFDDDFLAGCKLVVDNSKLYEAWEEEYPYPTYPQVQIIGTKFTDLKHDGKIEAEDIIDITDIIEKRHLGRASDDEIIVYSVGGMPVEDIAWGGTDYRNAVKLGIGIKLPLWDKPEMA